MLADKLKASSSLITEKESRAHYTNNFNHNANQTEIIFRSSKIPAHPFAKICERIIRGATYGTNIVGTISTGVKVMLMMLELWLMQR